MVEIHSYTFRKWYSGWIVIDGHSIVNAPKKFVLRLETVALDKSAQLFKINAIFIQRNCDNLHRRELADCFKSNHVSDLVHEYDSRKIHQSR